MCFVYVLIKCKTFREIVGYYAHNITTTQEYERSIFSSHMHFHKLIIISGKMLDLYIQLTTCVSIF